MTRKKIENKAKQLGQECFPDESNVWARSNIEAQVVENACIEMAKYTQRQMIDKAVKWTKENIDHYIGHYLNDDDTYLDDKFFEAFRKAMEE